MTTKKQLLILLSFLFSAVTAPVAAAEWIDVTASYIVNPSFEGDSNEGWSGTTIGHAVAVEAGEHWNQTFDSYQIITNLPNGKYRVSVQSFCRAHDISDTDLQAYVNGTATVNAYLYANNAKKELVNFYAEYSTVYITDGYNVRHPSTKQWVYFPNSMSGAVECFKKGLYWNSIEVEVTDGTLRIGQLRTVEESNNWTCFDNWKLEYWGDVVPVTGITFPASQLEISKGTTYQLSWTVLPSNATNKAVTWKSSKSTVATVNNGLVKANRDGTTVITATAQDGSGVSATCTVTVTTAYAKPSSCIINEVMPGNIDVVWDPSQNFGGFVEFYNPTDTGVYLGDYYLSDNGNKLKKWRIPTTVGSLPAKGYCTLWFDHYDYKYAKTQAPFTLDMEGDTIFLSDQNGKLMSSFVYPPAFRRASYARTTDGGDTWKWTAEPTPGASNNSSKFAMTQLDAPVVDTNGKVFSWTMEIHVNIPQGATLRYTTDGSVPTLTNGETSSNGTFTFYNTTVYRFRLFKDGYLPSDVVTRSYIYKEYNYNVPIISVVTNDENINSTDYGLFQKGPNGRPGNGQSSKCNWNREWDRPVSMEYIEEGEEIYLDQEVDMAMCGGWSRAFTPHSFKLKANKLYGQNYLPHNFFDEKPYIKNKTLQIRNGGNDTNCRFKDAALQSIVASSGLNIDCQSYKPVFVYLNGKFYSVLNMREPNNKHFATANWGIDTDEMDQFELSPDSGYVQKEGDRTVFDQWYSLSDGCADVNTYNSIKRLVDIDEFINYMAVEMYFGCQDWINNSNNMKAYRRRSSDGKFRFVLFDLDSAFGTTSLYSGVESAQVQTLDPLYDCEVSAYTKEIEPITIWLNMLQNKDFCKQYADALCIVAGSVFNPDRCLDILDSLYERANSAMYQTGDSPYYTYYELRNAITTSRAEKVVNATKNYSKLALYNTKTISGSLSSNISEATLRINDLPVPTGKFSGQLFPPITVKAAAPRGYRFLGWAQNGGGGGGESSKTLIAKGATWSYYDQGSLDDEDWTSASYTEYGWEKGAAPLGYYTSDYWNERGYQTILDYGEDTQNKRPTYYFRTSVQLDKAPSSEDVFYFNYIADDGFVVYVNGVYAGSYLMNSQKPSYDEYAYTHAPGNPQDGYLYLSADLFKKGTNIISVEVHNNSASSTDIYWDCALTYTTEDEEESGSYVSTDPTYTLPTTGTFNLVATYKRIPEEELYENLATPVKINEVSADNSLFINEYWKRNDWIELYNTTSDEVDVRGMYISDNVENPLKYQIPYTTPANTSIEPFGHLVLWCDKLEDAAQLHTSFKLAKEGGYIVLTSADQEWADTLQYNAHTDIQTVGRYPDGGASAYVMNIPTIGKANILETYDKSYQEQRPTPTFLDDLSETAREQGVYDLSGRCVPDGLNRFNNNTLPAGIYIINGRKVHVR